VACATIAALLAFISSSIETVQPNACNVKNIDNQIAKFLKSVDQESNLQEKRRITKRALRDVTELAGKTRKCGCEKPTAKLDAAAVHLRQAREAGSYLQISTYVHRAIEEINASATLMETCDVK